MAKKITPTNSQLDEFTNFCTKAAEDFKPFLNLQIVLDCPIAATYMMSHCKKEFCCENFYAIKDCERVLKADSDEAFLQLAKQFEKDFLLVSSKQEINIPKHVLKNLKWDDCVSVRGTFEKIKIELESNLKDPFARFLRGDDYEETVVSCAVDKPDHIKRVRLKKNC